MDKLSRSKINTGVVTIALLLLSVIPFESCITQTNRWRAASLQFSDLPGISGLHIEGYPIRLTMYGTVDETWTGWDTLRLWQFDHTGLDSSLIWTLNLPNDEIGGIISTYLIGDFNLNGHLDIAFRYVCDAMAWDKPVVIFELIQNDRGTTELHQIMSTDPSGIGGFRDIDKDGSIELVSYDGCGDEHTWKFVDAIYSPIDGRFVLTNRMFNQYFDNEIQELADDLSLWTRQWRSNRAESAHENIRNMAVALMHLSASKLDSSAIEHWYNHLLPVFREVVCSTEYHGWMNILSERQAISRLESEKYRAIRRMERLREIDIGHF